jgi:hypothetical protein
MGRSLEESNSKSGAAGRETRRHKGPLKDP